MDVLTAITTVIVKFLFRSISTSCHENYVYKIICIAIYLTKINYKEFRVILRIIISKYLSSPIFSTTRTEARKNEHFQDPIPRSVRVWCFLVAFNIFDALDSFQRQKFQVLLPIYTDLIYVKLMGQRVLQN